MTYIPVFIALIILSNQGCLVHEKIDESGQVICTKGLPAKLIEAMIADDYDIPEDKLAFSDDLLLALDEINNLKLRVNFSEMEKTETIRENAQKA